jgi:hypothetical protein
LPTLCSTLTVYESFWKHQVIRQKLDVEATHEHLLYIRQAIGDELVSPFMRAAANHFDEGGVP